MQEIALNSDAMRLIVQLRRILHNDHGVEIALDDDFALERLFDSTREARDRKAEELAHRLCESLRALNRDSKGLKVCERLSPSFRSPLHEQMVGSNPGYVYRGRPMRSQAPSPQASPSAGDNGEAASEDRPQEKKVIVYRGQRLEV